ncbi:MAG: NAD(P)H-dependent oxidoreductase [Solitalea sp.]
MNLKIITSTTRPGRHGSAVAKWVHALASQQSGMNVELLDLSEINLPLLDEPNHPRLGQYQHQHTKAWSAKIAEADAFIIVLAEYNYGFPAPIKNAIDYLFKEWAYKPVGIVSYGGVSGGLRSAQMLKQVVTTLHMMPLNPSVTIQFVAQYINAEGEFVPDDAHVAAAGTLFAELNKWAQALKTIRA